MAVAIWFTALLIYLAFRLWYDGLRKPMSRDEVEQFMAVLEQRAADGLNTPDADVARKFLEDDDGREFIMYNLLQFNPSPVSHPDTGEPSQARLLLTEYFRPFMGRVIRRAGHPVIAGRVAGGYLDRWNTPPDPGWHGAGLVRYRSRRDAMEVSLGNASFDSLHKYKVAALKQTFAVPVQTQMGLYASPRVTVALALALAAALLQLALT